MNYDLIHYRFFFFPLPKVGKIIGKPTVLSERIVQFCCEIETMGNVLFYLLLKSLEFIVIEYFFLPLDEWLGK